MAAETKPKGLYYIENFIDEDLNCQVLEWFDLIEDSLVPISESTNSRKVMHYGYEYNYKSGSIKPAGEFPEIIKKLKGLVESTVSKYIDQDYNFDQCIVNRYLRGQGIAPHIDNENFGSCIACLTFGGGREM